MPAQMWEDPTKTSALEAAKAEMKRKQELAREKSVSQADEDPEKTREWEAIKGGSRSQQQASPDVAEPEKE